MIICFVGPANSSHIVKWCNWFNSRGHETHVISFVQGKIENTSVHLVNIGVDANGSDIRKIKYLLTGSIIRRIIENIHPDVINAHYATSYGTAMALSGIKGYVLSVWGSDIYDFPKKSPLHKALLKYSLKKAGHLFSTSQAMADEAAKYTERKFFITPFGVDVSLFNPNKRTRENDSYFIVGTVKGLSDKYGIRYILKAVADIKNECNIPIMLRIAGKGPQEQDYHKLADKLNISNITSWLGYISQEKAAEEWANMDVAIIPSTLESESFGVSAVEAQACGTAVIITDIPGLMEATKPGVTSVVVPRNDSDAIRMMIVDLYNNQEKRLVLGAEGRNFVMQKYELNECFERIESYFKQFLQ